VSRHTARQTLAREFGATDIVTERGDEGVARIKDLTNGIGADSALECVGTHESMMQALRATRPGGSVGYVGVPHGVALEGQELFFSHVHLDGGPAPVRRFLPALIELVWKRTIDPCKVFDLSLPLDQVAEGYRAMDECRDQDAAAPVRRCPPVMRGRKGASEARGSIARRAGASDVSLKAAAPRPAGVRSVFSSDSPGGRTSA
jgi:threonine dehydrogenase-like Zn-dependent dehydrogenase